MELYFKDFGVATRILVLQVSHAPSRIHPHFVESRTRGEVHEEKEVKKNFERDEAKMYVFQRSREGLLLRFD